MSWVGQGIKLQTTLKNTARLSEIITVFGSCGFTPWIKKLHLSRWVSPIQQHPELKNLPLPERLRIAFEHLGPTFIKFGQILATRQDLLPQAYIASFEKLQDQAQVIDFKELETVLIEELGPDLQSKFKFIDPKPLGSASIAQVHRAQLISEEWIVLKIQKPQVIVSMKEDLRILMLLSELIHESIAELKAFSLPDLVAEFTEALTKETEFYLEANNLRKFNELFANHPHLKIPKVYWEYTTDRVLALEELKGFLLTQPPPETSIDFNPDTYCKIILENYLTQVFINGYFHGDLHPGNVFILPNNQFGLIDFGLMGRLSHKTKIAVIKMLQSLAHEDYESLALEYVHLSPFDDKISPEKFAVQLRQIISPYFGLNLKKINMGEILIKTAHLASKEGIQVPRELLLFFKSLVGIESVLRKLNPEFDFLQSSLDFAESQSSHEVHLNEWKKSLELLIKDSEHLVKDLPKQIHFTLKKWNSPQFELKLGGRGLENLKHEIQILSLSLFWGLIGSSLILAISLFMIFDKSQPHNLIFGLVIGLGFILIFSHFRIKKD